MGEYKCNGSLDYTYAWDKTLYSLWLCDEWIKSFIIVLEKNFIIMCNMFEEIIVEYKIWYFVEIYKNILICVKIWW